MLHHHFVAQSWRLSLAWAAAVAHLVPGRSCGRAYAVRLMREAWEAESRRKGVTLQAQRILKEIEQQ